jgi:hypothetical protein
VSAVSDMMNSTVQVLINALTAFLAAFLTYIVATRMERHKESRSRQAIAIVLQAELIRIHRKIKEHGNHLTAYAGRFAKEINAVEAMKYVPINMDDDFIVYRSCIKEIGLFELEAAYSTVYCYGNMSDLLKLQDRFLRDLPELANSSLIGSRAAEISAHEVALARQIERVVPFLASQSKALPFSQT